MLREYAFHMIVVCQIGFEIEIGIDCDQTLKDWMLDENEIEYWLLDIDDQARSLWLLRTLDAS